MWFKLASATFSTHLGSMASLSNSISIKYTANGFSYTTTSVSKTASQANLVLNLMSGWECKSTPTVSVSGAAVVNGTPTWSNGKLTIAIRPASSKSTFEAAGTIINVSVSGATAISSGGSGGTNYTFTINPNPTSATVTLSATGYSTVSGTGSKSITVANGTKVNWSVSASGYTTRTGSWTANGSNETLPVVLTASGGGGTGGDTSNLLTENPYFVTTGMPTQMTNSSYGTKIGYDYGGFICKGIKSASTGKGNSFNVYAGAKGSNGLVESDEKVGTFTYTKEKGIEEEFLFSSPIDLTGDIRLTCNGSFMWRQSTPEEQNNPPQGVGRLQTNTPLYYYWYIFQ